MSELPPLPDTNDPHELLGVPESADELTLKRAYLRLIRTYRPEIAPAAFQRLHQAYERAREFLQWTRWIEPGDAHADQGESSAADAEEDPAHTSLREAWEALHAGDADGALRRVESVSRDRPGSVLAVAHRALLAEAIGAPPDEVTAPLVDLLGTDTPAASWMTGVFQPDDVDASLTGRTARWARLRAQPNRHAAVRLLRRRWHGMLLGGRTIDAIREALEPPYLEDAHDDHWLLAEPALEVAIAAAWRHPAEAERLMQEHGHGAANEDGSFTLEDQYHMIQMEDLDGAFRRAFDAAPLPPLLERWFTLWPILDTDEQLTLAESLVADMEQDPTPHLAAFDRMAAEAPALIGRHADSVEHVGVPPDAEVPLLQRARVEDELAQLARSVPRRQLGSRNKDYRRSVRAVFVRAVVSRALSPRHISWWLAGSAQRRGETRVIRALVHHSEALADDLAIAGLYWTCRLRELSEIVDP